MTVFEDSDISNLKIALAKISESYSVDERIKFLLEASAYINRGQKVKTQPAAAVSEPVAYLAKGTRFKTTLLGDGSVRITGLPYELAGRWVALVAAENDMHLKATPPAEAKREQEIRQISEAARRYGLTLVKTAKGYDFMNLGEIKAYNIGAKEQ